MPGVRDRKRKCILLLVPSRVFETRVLKQRVWMTRGSNPPGSFRVLIRRCILKGKVLAWYASYVGSIPTGGFQILVAVSQLVEREPEKFRVGGSIPSCHIYRGGNLAVQSSRLIIEQSWVRIPPALLTMKQAKKTIKEKESSRLSI